MKKTLMAGMLALLSVAAQAQVPDVGNVPDDDGRIVCENTCAAPGYFKQEIIDKCRQEREQLVPEGACYFAKLHYLDAVTKLYPGNDKALRELRKLEAREGEPCNFFPRSAVLSSGCVPLHLYKPGADGPLPGKRVSGCIYNPAPSPQCRPEWPTN